MVTAKKQSSSTKQARPRKAANRKDEKSSHIYAASIYALCCPDTMKVRYIGKANEPEKRLKSHMKDCMHRNTPVYCWIKKLRKLGKVPVMKVLEVANDWRDAERRLIFEYRAKGNLLNVADGGDEPSCPDHVRAENGRKVARIVHDNPYKRKVWEMKRMMGEYLTYCIRTGDRDAEQRQRVRMRELSVRRPDICSSWASV